MEKKFNKQLNLAETLGTFNLYDSMPITNEEYRLSSLRQMISQLRRDGALKDKETGKDMEFTTVFSKSKETMIVTRIG